MADYTYLTLVIQEKVGTVTLNHPPANALNADMLDEFGSLLDEILICSDVKVLLITSGLEHGLLAGGDIATFAKITSVQEMLEYIVLGQQVFTKLDTLGIPTIAVINGTWVGGGLELALACDMRYAADTALLGLPEIGLGLIPGWGGTQRLPRVIGRSRAMEMILTGDVITAQQASAIGLVNRVLPAATLLQEAQATGKKIATKSKFAVKGALQAIADGAELPMEYGLQTEQRVFEIIGITEDMREGVQAFLEKRTPIFKDK